MKKNIAIIGGGMNGLTCAYYLSKKGYIVELFERSSQVGGLVSGFELFNTSLEKAYHHIFTTDQDIISLAQELGIQQNLVWHDSSVAAYVNHKLLPFNNAHDLIKFSELSLFNRIRLGLVIYYLQKRSSSKGLINISASSWLQKWCGEQGYFTIWQPLLKGKFDKYYQEVSMAWLWARIHTRGNSRKSPFEKEKLGYFEGGFQAIITALENEILSNNGMIYPNANISGMSFNENTKTITFKSNNIIKRFDAVIGAVPPASFIQLTSGLGTTMESYNQKLSTIQYIGAICLVFTSSQSLSKYYWHNIHDSLAPFLVFIQHTNLVGTQSYQGQNVYYIGTYVPHDHKYFSMTNDEITTTYFSYLKTIFPKFDQAEVNTVNVFKLKNAQHIVTSDYNKKIPSYKTPTPLLYFSHFCQIFPEDRGTNYAVKQGKSVADLVDSDLTSNN